MVIRTNSYNIIRFIAASLVILGHMFVLSGELEPKYLGLPIQTQGLNILLVISGYWIVQSCRREDSFSVYLVKRLFRLIPALYVCVLLTTFVVGPIFSWLTCAEYYVHPQCRGYLLNLLFCPQYSLPGVFAENPYPHAVNGSLWSLPVELVLYLVMWITVYIVIKGKRNWTNYALVTAAVCLIHVLIMCFWDDRRLVIWGTDWLGAFDLFPFFFLGGLYCFIPRTKYCHVPMAVLLLLAGLGLHTDNTVLNEILSYVIIPYVVITVGECRNLPGLERLEDATYGMYLWGFPIQQCLEAVCLKNGFFLKTGSIKFLICVGASWLMGMLSGYTVERWGSSCCKKITGKIGKAGT